ncbi:DUF3520 domain-containing protein [bacterium]|nr:DUF3520 domain-containing protein [bacterium]
MEVADTDLNVQQPVHGGRKAKQSERKANEDQAALRKMFGTGGVIPDRFGSGASGNVHSGSANGVYLQPEVLSGGAAPGATVPVHPSDPCPVSWNTEEYKRIYENPFRTTVEHPLSTFSIDVDIASYTNVRRFIRGGQLPPPDAVRIEEMVNYFHYAYPVPEEEQPFALYTEMGACPWNEEHHLLHVGLQGRVEELENLPPSNLVFLLDVSGSMSDDIQLVKAAFRMLTNRLRARDRVAIVVYAGSSGLVLPPTPGDDRDTILAALSALQAGGSTAGGAGIQLAYKTAMQHFHPEGNNRVILATDGDFNVGVSSEGELVRIVEEKREGGIFLSVLGFGTGNYKDSKMEMLADKGNGNYAYIADVQDAKRVMVEEMAGTLYAIAKDVKLQIEFNPARVQSYRLIGYENRMLDKEDFTDDKKDAGEIGLGHTVTALYEIVPTTGGVQTGEKLRYSRREVKTDPAHLDEWAIVKFRYKQPDEDTSRPGERVITDQPNQWIQTSDDFRFSAAVAAFGMLLRESDHKGDVRFEDVLSWARACSVGPHAGERQEFIDLADAALLLK